MPIIARIVAAEYPHPITKHESKEGKEWKGYLIIPMNGHLLGYSVVAALTTVGLIGKEGLIIRKNIFISILYGLLVGIVAWIIVTLFFPYIF